MAFQSVPDTALFVASFSGPDGVQASFGVYSRNSSAPWDATQLATMAGLLTTSIEDDYLPFLSNEWTFVNVVGRDLEAEFGLVHEHAASNSPGTLGSPSLPAEVSLVATWKGQAGLPPRQGRMNFMPPAENQVVGNIVQAGPLASLQAAAQSIHDALETGAATHVIVSRYSGTELVPGPRGQTLRKPLKRAAGVTNGVDSVIVHPRVDSQRKRRPSE